MRDAVICIEDLNIKAMQRIWGRKIYDLGHSQFVNILKYQASKPGTSVVEILVSIRQAKHVPVVGIFWMNCNCQ
jgi:IS605 OrfB family transposase